MGKVCFIVPYFGEEPYWFNYFLHSAANNKNYAWLIFTNFTLGISSSNIKHIKLTLHEFNNYVSNRLGLETNIENPYKICDFKPAFGDIFKEYIQHFDYWAYCDTDIILGDLDLFLIDILTLNLDIISPDENFFPGHFCIFRNTDYVNTLYKNSLNYKLIFESPENYYFDEFLLKSGVYMNNARYKKTIRKILLKQIVFRRLKVLFTGTGLTSKIRKRRVVLRDFNSVVRYFAQRGETKVYNKKLYESDFTFATQGIKNWSVEYRNGRLYYQGAELLYFHFQLGKNSNQFYIEETNKDEFTLAMRHS
jgi:hypothetical protein